MHNVTVGVDCIDPQCFDCFDLIERNCIELRADAIRPYGKPALVPVLRFELRTVSIVSRRSALTVSFL